MIICVGSENPIKIKAVKIAFKKYFKKVDVHSKKVNSGVPNQPIGMDTIITGAINRAKLALNHLINIYGKNENLLGVGIEAGLVKISPSLTGYMDFQFCAIIDKKGKITLGSGVAFEYPKKVIDKIISNKDLEIGKVMGDLSKNPNLKREGGAISVLSKNKITRKKILTLAISCALFPRINENLYK